MTAESATAETKHPPLWKRAARRFQRIDWLPPGLILPAVILFSLLLGYPILRGLYLSLFDVSILDRTGGEFVGLENYRQLLGDPRFWHSLWVTVTYTALSVVATYFIGLGIALLLNREFRGSSIVQTGLIFPWAVPAVVAVLIFKWMLDAQYGIVNDILMDIGIIDQPIAWLTSSASAFPAVVATTVWKQFPIAALVLLAGLKAVPVDIIEASEVDGATAWQRFRHITIPSIRSVNYVLLLVLILQTFRRTVIVFTMTGGGPAKATETLPVYTFLEAFRGQRIGYASTIGAAVLVLLLIITVVYSVALLRGED
ncbi:MAG: sugar ABC transporter permease [Actinomycetota bacterium]